MTQDQAYQAKRSLQQCRWANGCEVKGAVHRTHNVPGGFGVYIVMTAAEGFTQEHLLVVPLTAEMRSSLEACSVGLVESAWESQACVPLPHPDHVELRPDWQWRTLVSLERPHPVHPGARELAIALVERVEIDDVPEPKVYALRNRRIVMTWHNPDLNRSVSVECQDWRTYEICSWSPDDACDPIAVRGGRNGRFRGHLVDPLRSDLAWCFPAKAMGHSQWDIAELAYVKNADAA